jgi:hypothetical protein
VPKYAADTSVSVEASRAEIERTLQRYGADQFMYGWDAEQAVVQFRMQGRHVRFLLPLPAKDAREFTHQPVRGNPRTEAQAYKAWEQACRQRWRALNLVIKAKLEAVDAEISTIEDEFMAHLVLPDGQTVGQWLGPQIEDAYQLGKMPSMLAIGPGS